MIGVYTGPRHSGKTTRLAALCREWRAAGRAVDGYLSPAVRDGRDGSPSGYDLFEIKTEAVRPFLRREDAEAGGRAHGAEPDGERVGRWVFVPAGLARAVDIIRSASVRDLLVVDEFGPLELRGGGVRPALDEALLIPGRRALVVVREALREAFLETRPAAGAIVYEAGRPGVGEDLARDFFGESG